MIGAIDSQIPAEWPQVRKQITPGNFVSHLLRRTAMHPCGSDTEFWWLSPCSDWSLASNRGIGPQTQWRFLVFS